MKATVKIDDVWYNIPLEYALALNNGDYIQIKDDGKGELIEGFVKGKSMFIGTGSLVIDCDE